MNGNSGRHTQPPVESLERYIRHRWAAIHADDVVTDEEERDLVLLDVVLDAPSVVRSLDEYRKRRTAGSTA